MTRTTISVGGRRERDAVLIDDELRGLLVPETWSTIHENDPTTSDAALAAYLAYVWAGMARRHRRTHELATRPGSSTAVAAAAGMSPAEWHDYHGGNAGQ